jgi:antitoxin ParD1/3/4
MVTMNISLSAELKAFIDEQVGSRGYTSTSEYVRELIRHAQDRERLRALLLEGTASPLSDVVADKAHFDGLRAKARAQRGEPATAKAHQDKSATATRTTAKVKRGGGH